MPAVSVIIVSYKVRYYIEQCLNSVLRSVPDAQILVVDNKSDDGSVEFLRERFPGAEIIANDFNAGFGKANNMALAKATGRYGRPPRRCQSGHHHPCHRPQRRERNEDS